MVKSVSVENPDWWQLPQPTAEELRLSGGLLVEDWPHARQVERLSTQLFHATQPLHELDDHALRLLERAAFLHNTGMMIESRRHHKHSFRLIKETRLPDFTDEERHEIACIARYHRRALPSTSHEEFAQSDNSTWTIALKIRPLADLDAELEHAYEKADLFEKTFKRKLHLIIKN